MIYNTQNFAMDKYNLDADSIYFARELEQIKSREFNVLHAVPNLMRLVPIDSTTDVGAKIVTYNQYDSTGDAKIISDRATDIPSVNEKGKQFSSNIESIGDSYSISLQDIRSGRFANKPLEPRLVNTAQRAIMRKINEIGFFGEAEYNIQGWMSNANITNTQVAAGGGGRTWAVKTPDEIIKDIFTAYSNIVDGTNGVEVPNYFVTDIASYFKLSNTPRSAVSDTTILEFVQAQLPGVTFDWANELKNKFTGNSNGFIMYTKSPDKMYQEMPEAFEMMPAERKGLVWEVICHARYGGVIVPYPQAQAKWYGI